MTKENSVACAESGVLTHEKCLLLLTCFFEKNIKFCSGLRLNFFARISFKERGKVEKYTENLWISGVFCVCYWAIVKCVCRW